MVPSSVTASAQKNAYIPPRTHTAITSPEFCRRDAISPGVRKMPTPIVFPMITAIPKLTPRMRSRCPLGRAEGTLGLDRYSEFPGRDKSHYCDHYTPDSPHPLKAMRKALPP